MNHPSVKILLKPRKTHVDKEIVPIIRWLNEFHYVLTTWSCQGGKPYVTFLCGCEDTLEEIKKTLDKSKSVHYSIELCLFRQTYYKLTFKDKTSLNAFIRVVKKYKFMTLQELRKVGFLILPEKINSLDK